MLPERFSEKLGRFFFSQLRPFFFFILLLTPLLSALFILWIQNGQISDMEERLQQAQTKAKSALERKINKEKFLLRYSRSNPYFLDQQIESMQFLQNEKTQIESLLRHPALVHKEPLEERIQFLSSVENRLGFTEEEIRSSEKLKETEEKQRHPVQMDEQDLQKLLAVIEDLTIDSFNPIGGSPQILMRDFRMKKIKTPLQKEILEVEMDLIKREFKYP